MTNSLLPEGQFDFVVKTPGKDSAVAKNWLRQAVETTFGLSAKRESREMDVLVLTVGNPTAQDLTPSVSTGGASANYGPGHFQGVNLPIEVGLELTRAKRQVEVLVVDKAKSSAH